MKIVDRKTFLSLPENIIFSKFEPMVFDGLCIKGETIGDDFWYVDLIGNIDACDTGDFMDTVEEGMQGKSMPLDFECYARDGMFDEDQLFAVYEKSDVCNLISKLKVRSMDLAGMKLANKDAMISSLVAERSYVKENCCEKCKMLFDSETDDAEILIKEWEDGTR